VAPLPPREERGAFDRRCARQCLPLAGRDEGTGSPDRTKELGLFTLANSSTIKERKAFYGFDRLWRIEQKMAQE
jgi:hypothetical protein